MIRTAAMEALANALAAQSWGVWDDFLEVATCQSLAREIRALGRDAQLTPAGIGKGSQFRREPGLRSDAIYWLDEANLSVSQQEVWSHLDALRLSLNRQLYLGLRCLEAHLTAYPPTGHYAKHVDNFQGSSDRVVSCVVYLNEGWQVGDGGELWLYSPTDPELRVAEIPPRAGTLACFLSREVPHEVAATTKARFSLTGWFR